MAITAVQHVKPVLDRKRLLLGIDDTPTARYGPFVEGCGTHTRVNAAKFPQISQIKRICSR